MKKLSLEEVGKELILDNLRGKPTVRIVMGIKTPKGRCLIFGRPVDKLYQYSNHLRQVYNDNQCEAIKAFMEEHSYD